MAGRRLVEGASCAHARIAGIGAHLRRLLVSIRIIADEVAGYRRSKGSCARYDARRAGGHRRHDIGVYRGRCGRCRCDVRVRCQNAVGEVCVSIVEDDVRGLGACSRQGEGADAAARRERRS